MNSRSFDRAASNVEQVVWAFESPAAARDAYTVFASKAGERCFSQSVAEQVERRSGYLRATNIAAVRRGMREMHLRLRAIAVQSVASPFGGTVEASSNIYAQRLLLLRGRGLSMTVLFSSAGPLSNSLYKRVRLHSDRRLRKAISMDR